MKRDRLPRWASMLICIAGIESTTSGHAMAAPPNVGAADRTSTAQVETSTIIINAVDSGWYDSSGLHQPENVNWIAGKIEQVPGVEYRNFFVFDVPPLAEVVVAAELVLFNQITPIPGYQSPDATETYVVYDVTMAVDELLSGGGGTAAFNDLGSGKRFGQRIVSAEDNGQTVGIVLGQEAIRMLNCARGRVAIGGAIVTLRPVDGPNEFIFGNSDRPPHQRELHLTLDSEPQVIDCSFLRIPACKENDFNGFSCSRSVSGIHSWAVTAILDHSGSYYQPDGTVKAFVTDLQCASGAPCIGEVEYGSNSPPAGYRLDCVGTPIDFGSRLSYVGADSGTGGECDPPLGNTETNAYMNYDGHSGYDLDTTFGDVVLAAAAGTLEFPPSPDAVVGDAASFNALRIQHSNGLESWYLHTQPGSECDLAGLCAGDQSVIVQAGQAIALAGNTGLGCGPCTVASCPCDHLHFEVRVSSSPTEVVDPFGCSSDVALDDPIRCSTNRLWLDEILIDGFETGDLRAWSTTVP